MSKVRVAVWGTVGKSVFIDTGLEPRVTALEEALANLSGSTTTQRHSSLQGLQIGNDHPQYPLSRGRETIRGQWDFTQQIWASFGNAAAPGYAFTEAVDTGLFGSFTAGDPYFASVVALLHANGSDGGTTFTDSSSYARTVTPSGGVNTDTGVVRFGSASAQFPQANGALTFPYTAELAMTTGDWTVEYWFRRDNGGGMNIEKYAFVTPYSIRIINGATISASGANAAGVTVYQLTSSAVAFGQWYHVAVVRSGSSFMLFLDGVLQETDTFAGTLGDLNTPGWTFGAASGADCWVDDFRLTIGVARYTANFTPPTAQLPDSGDVTYESITVAGAERFRFADAGQLGIGGATYGSAGNYFRSGGASAPPTWTATEALTRTNDTNVTLTLGGAPTTALFTATSMTIGWSGQLSVPRGGTGLATVAQGDLLYGSAADTYSRLATVATATRYLSNTGTSNNPAWAQVNLANGVTGDLPFANLAQGVALSVLGVTGNALADVASIAAGVDGQVLRRNGTTLTFGTTMPATLTWADNAEVQLGTGSDLRLFHDGTNSTIRNDTGVLDIVSTGDLDLGSLADVNIGTLQTVNIDFGVALNLNGVPVGEFIQDAVGTILLDSSSIDFTYNDGVPSITANVLPAGVDHNALANLTTGDPHTQYPLAAGTETISGAWTFTGTIVGNNDFSLIQAGSPGFELRSTGGGTPFLDFSNDGVVDFDARIILVSDDVLAFRGANIQLDADNQELQIGAGQDLRLYHDGTNAFIRNDTGVLNINQGATTVGRFDTDATAGNTRFMVYDVDNGTLERVSVGAADSGGVGFKVLRIPN